MATVSRDTPLKCVRWEDSARDLIRALLPLQLCDSRSLLFFITLSVAAAPSCTPTHSGEKERKRMFQVGQPEVSQQGEMVSEFSGP